MVFGTGFTLNRCAISQWQQLLAPEGEIVAVHEPDIDPQSQFSGGKISMIAEDVFQVYDKADIWNSVFTSVELLMNNLTCLLPMLNIPSLPLIFSFHRSKAQ
ncbi:hypothetical protein T4B_5367 [Trichinella pseudospiralis]|uniref:Uncharacterized protein n=1 Tax=Trichinella pseudospiralis TaxID=6337 RepID=A0A0V1K2L5_TRIPS|nr:hypothetical protein T4A_1935 [Trichinella pseudospiralis]KRZ03175.1 hypothetical protein T4B_5367 [Trichinella pseudospiralis]KRZ41468.1 hypothetical protein T4C_13264 [Trichinella pseudospiralis]